MNYTVREVANGFIVTPTYDPSVGRGTPDKDIYVFATWVACAAWLGSQAKAKA